MKKKLISICLIIASLMSMPVTFVTASALTPGNISYGRFDFSAGNDSATFYKTEYTDDEDGNHIGVDIKFTETQDTRSDLIMYCDTKGVEAKFVHNRFLIALEDCGVTSGKASESLGFRVSHFIKTSWIRQLNFSKGETSIYDGDHIARGYSFAPLIKVSTTSDPYYNVFDWIWDCENGIQYVFIDGALAAYTTNAARDGKFYGFSIEKMDNCFDIGDIFSVKYDPECPGHTIYKDTASHEVTIEDVISNAKIENCNYASYRSEILNDIKLINAALNDDVYEVKGSGLVVQVEDVSHAQVYSESYDRKAGGQKTLKSGGYFPNTPQKDETPHLDLKFTVSETATYAIWLRAYSSSSKNDQLFVGINDEDYSAFKVIRETGDFEWNCIKVSRLEKDKIHNLKLRMCEGANYIDSILITKNPTFKPSGRYGSLPEKFDENATKLPADKYAEPPVNPPANEHPRVLFRKGDIEKIKKNFEAEQCAAARDYYNDRLSETIRTDWTSYDCINLQRIQVNALEYALNGDIERAKAAKAGILSFLEHNDIVGNPTGDSATRNGGYVIYTAALVYDWCYDVFTAEERKELIEGCIALAMTMEVGWPPDEDGVITSHSCEAQIYRDLLAFAIATYDERPDLWRHIGGRYYDELVEPRQFFVSSMFQGTNYGQYREIWSTWSYLLIRGMGEEVPNDIPALADMNYWTIYFRRPDGQNLRDGDEAQDSHHKMWKYWTPYPQYLMNLTALSDDQYLKYELARRAKNFDQFDGGNTYKSPVEWLITNNPDVEPAKSYEDLPLSKYFGGNNGYLLARTGWDDGVDSDNVVAEMKVGAYQTIGHQHLDAGHFQIYYKGILASDSGVYQGEKSSAASDGGTAYWSVHTNQYGTKTVAHNCMLVFDPNEGDKSDTQRGTINDGGQRIPHGGSQLVYMDYLEKYSAKTSTVEGVEIDPKNPKKPAYSYIKGDLTEAYTDKVSDYKRSFIFFNLENSEVPAAMIVFDKITSSDASFKKSWLLHGLEEPEIDGNRTIFRRTYKSNVDNFAYNGKLTVDTLLPKENTITKIGGEGMWSYVNGIDYTGLPLNSPVDEGNSWRIELSPKAASKDDYFLNVLQVSDNDKENYLPVEMIDAEKFYGAVISDRVVLFSKSGERENAPFTFDAPLGSDYQYTVCDIAAGSYKVISGENAQICAVSEEGGVLSFTADGGKVRVEPSDEAAEPAVAEPEETDAVETDKVLVRMNDAFVYTKRPTVLKGGAVMADPEIAQQFMEAEVNITDDTVVISRAKNSAVFTNGSDIAIVNGEEVQMYAVAQKTDDGWLVPLRAITEALDGKIEWDKFARTVYITKAKPDYTLPEGYAKVANVTADDGPVDGDHRAWDLADEDYDTRWTAEGTGRYVIIELQNTSTLAGIEISFNPHAQYPRNARFEVAVSDNGEDFTTIYDGVSDGSVEEGTWEYFEFSKPCTAKYVRYMGNGSNVNKWNAVKELRLKLN